MYESPWESTSGGEACREQCTLSRLSLEIVAFVATIQEWGNIDIQLLCLFNYLQLLPSSNGVAPLVLVTV